MKSSTLLSGGFSLLGVASAGPILKRAPNDADILNYALTLEHLENKFYMEGLANFTQQDFAKAGFDAFFYRNLKEVAYDESTHVKFLTNALQAAGAPATAECTYAFGVTSVEAFVKTASILEGVGVTAYLGAAASIADKTYLTAAGSILTVEARHTAFLRGALKEAPIPQPFDVPLDFAEVYTLAAPFIKSCPSTNPPLSSLGIKAFPSLMLTSSGTIKTGSEITLSASLSDYKGAVYAAFITVTGPVFAKADCSSKGSIKVTVPANVHGQSYLILTSSGLSVSDDTTLAGPAIVEISGTDGMPM